MTGSELERLFNESRQRIAEIEQKYKSGERMTRQDCLSLRECNARLHLVGRELWIKQGKPSDPDFDCFRRPHVKSPLPETFALNLTNFPTEDVH